MSDIVLVAETGSDIPVETAKQYGIHLVPMHVSFGTITLDDGTFPMFSAAYLPNSSLFTFIQ